MFLLDWLTSLLRLLGLSSKKARIVILGVLHFSAACSWFKHIHVSYASAVAWRLHEVKDQRLFLGWC